MTGTESEASPIRWLVRPEAPDGSLSAALHALARPQRSDTAELPDSWTAIPTEGPRRVFRRLVGDHTDYLKFFPEDRFSFRRRAGLAIWPTPARRHVEWSKTLSSLGVRVAPLIAAGELAQTARPFRQPPSFILTRSPITATTVETAERSGSLNADQRTRIASDILTIAKRLHARGIARLDLRAANVLIYSPDEPPVLFDIDRLIRVGILNRRARLAKDMERLRATCTMLLRGTGTPIEDLMNARESTP